MQTFAFYGKESKGIKNAVELVNANLMGGGKN